MIYQQLVERLDALHEEGVVSDALYKSARDAGKRELAHFGLSDDPKVLAHAVTESVQAAKAIMQKIAVEDRYLLEESTIQPLYETLCAFQWQDRVRQVVPSIQPRAIIEPVREQRQGTSNFAFGSKA